MTHGVSDMLEVLLLAKEVGLFRWRGAKGSSISRATSTSCRSSRRSTTCNAAAGSCAACSKHRPIAGISMRAATSRRSCSATPTAARTAGSSPRTATLYDTQARLAACAGKPACARASSTDAAARWAAAAGAPIAQFCPSRPAVSMERSASRNRARSSRSATACRRSATGTWSRSSMPRWSPRATRRHSRRCGKNGARRCITWPSDRSPCIARWCTKIPSSGASIRRRRRSATSAGCRSHPGRRHGRGSSAGSNRCARSRGSSRGYRTAYVVPGWYGLGSALKDYAERSKENAALLGTMYRDWLFFRMVINNAQLELLRADLPTAAWYARRVQPPELGTRMHERLTAGACAGA